jgi:segregation and condensation protein B
MNSDLLRQIVEGALLAAAKPLNIDRIEALFEDDERPPRDQIKAALDEIESDCRGRGFELKQVASGYRFQVIQGLATWVNRLWEEKPKRYSKSMLETLALIAYRQPLTRGDIEAVRGVAVSSDIIRSLQEREWVRIVGHRDVPGKPALYATTKKFLDYFNVKSLDHLPALSEIKDFSDLDPELELALSGNMPEQTAPLAANDEDAALGTGMDDFELDHQADGLDVGALAIDQLSTDGQKRSSDLDDNNQNKAVIDE